ncbi:MAG: DNA mismatch repair endonuclease MutL, partial [Gemmatimonadales bacterium]
MTVPALPRIRILPDHVANQIAAGEVVERPASVVKELVENALDAGASRVEIELRNGGKTLIRVSDNGEGMHRTDALLALDRHATSKIRSVEDLATVASFGFRGEALPSIAAVSRFELITAPASGDPGTEIQVQSGRIVSSGEAARQPGTTVTVRSLFQSLPVRAKFLRQSAAETRAASESIVLLALVNLRVGFRLESNGRELIDLAPAASLGDRVAELWGPAEAQNLLSIDQEEGGIRVAGLIQRPDAVRPAGGRRYLFVNGRPFRDPSVLKQVDEAYRTTVAPDLRPTVFLYLGVPAGQVDVNVHPSKAEVRFQDSAAVHAAVHAAVRTRLADLISTTEIRERSVVHEPSSATPPTDNSERSTAVPLPQLTLFVSRAEVDSALLEENPREVETADADPARSGPWQIQNSYILMPTRGGLLVIDQHSAHERVLFEQTMDRFAGATGESQRLLFPITLRLSPPEHSAAEELSGLLEAIGFEMESFGDRTVI